ncbi:MAG: DUF2017 family protein [Chthoniobacteraceae bacterium]
MEIHVSSQSLVLDGVDEFFAGLLRNIPEEAETSEDDPALERLYSLPSTDEEDEASEEWREYVHPELKTLFQDAMLTVRSDLQKMSAGRDENGEYRLLIERAHFEAWINALNQVTLALAARHQLTEADLRRRGMLSIFNERERAVFQIELFHQIQELLVRVLMGENED